MARRKVAYRKKNQNKFSMFLVTLVVIMIMAVVAIRSVDMQRQLEETAAKEASLNAQIEAENQRTEEIAEYEKYTQTKKYAEEVAQDKLGLVYEDEILFKEE